MEETFDGGYLLGGRYSGYKGETLLIARIDSHGRVEFIRSLAPYGDTFHV